MVKNLLSVLIAVALMCGLCFLEESVIKTSFDDFSMKIAVLSDKTTEKTATEEDGMALQAFWREKKKSLHVFLPHNDLKEVDLWISETVFYLAAGDFKEARAKLEVLADIAEYLPRSYRFSPDNFL